MEPKHDKVYLLLISETGRVKSRKISLRLIKYLVAFLVLLFAATSCFTYLYFRGLRMEQLTGNAKATLLRKIDALRAKISEQDLQITRLESVTKRLKRENEDLKKHLIAQKKTVKSATPHRNQPAENKMLVAYHRFLTRIENLNASSTITFQIREPRIVVSEGKTQVTFRLYKDTFKKVYGRYVLMGVFKPEDPEKVGAVTAYPPRSVSGFTLHPGYGHPFKIERRFLTVSATLLHPAGVNRFSEFHIFIFGTKKELLFHEKFKAP